MSQPASTTRQEIAGQTDTSSDSFVAPGQVTHQQVLLDAEDQVARLDEYLRINFPHEVDRSNRQLPESPVEIAVRLLAGLQAHASLQVGARCGQAYCNKPEAHTDGHGWIHY